MEEVAGGSRPFASQTELTGTLAAEPSCSCKDKGETAGSTLASEC